MTSRQVATLKRAAQRPLAVIGEGRALVAVGGGSGLSTLLRGLKHHVGHGVRELQAVVTVSDDGGSSGRLRRELGVLPPGDIRNCLCALADDEDLLARLFQYRFPGGDGLADHSFGNLFLTALTGITGDFYQAILTAETILSVRGRILPATLTDLRLRARGRSGKVYEGESAVGASGEPLVELAILPAAPPAFPAAARALREADLIILGPGSLYTSILPNLLIPAIHAAISASGARVVLPLNLMTQPGETDGMSGPEHLDAIAAHVGADLVHTVLVNDAPLPKAPLYSYEASGSVPVQVDEPGLRARGVAVVSTDLLAAGPLIRHDPAKLSAAIVELARGAASSRAKGGSR